MEPTYRILGGDGKEYGPVVAAQLRQWARDGRVDGTTRVRVNDSPTWVPVETLAEFADLRHQPAPPVAEPVFQPNPTPPRSPAAGEPAELVARLHSGASWFYWVAALTAINSVLSFSGAGFRFAIGLGVSAEMDHLFRNSAAVALAFDLVACTIIAAFGFFALRRQLWAFIVGMLVLGLDTVLVVMQEAWMSAAFHGWALVSIFMAFTACRALNRR